MSEKNPPKARPHPPMMPNVRGAQVIGLIDITFSLGPSTNLRKLASKFGNDISTLLPSLDAAEMLGLLKRQNDEIALTDLGLKFQKVPESISKIPLLRDQLSKIEPFRTTLELLSHERKVRTSDIAKTLGRMNIRWDLNRDRNESLIHGILINWGTFAGLFSHNSETEEFRKSE